MTAPGVGGWIVLAFQSKFLVPTLSLVGALLAGAVVIALFRYWYRAAPPGLGSAEDLARYRALYERGEISEEEYRSLVAVLGGGLKREINLHPRPTKDARPPAAPSTDVQTPPGTGAAGTA